MLTPYTCSSNLHRHSNGTQAGWLRLGLSVSENHCLNGGPVTRPANENVEPVRLRFRLRNAKLFGWSVDDPNQREN